jgi:hypothetical protein
MYRFSKRFGVEFTEDSEHVFDNRNAAISEAKTEHTQKAYRN